MRFRKIFGNIKVFLKVENLEEIILNGFREK